MLCKRDHWAAPQPQEVISDRPANGMHYLQLYPPLELRHKIHLLLDISTCVSPRTSKHQLELASTRKPDLSSIGDCGKSRNSRHYCKEYKTWQPLWETTSQFLYKFNRKTFHKTQPFQLPRRNKGICPQKGTVVNIHDSGVHNEWNQMSAAWRRNKQTVLHQYNGTLLAIKGKELLIFAAMWMKLKNILLSKRRQTEKTTDFMIPFIQNVLKKANQ